MTHNMTAIVSKSRDVRVHGELWHTSSVLLRHGQEQPQGSTHQFRASLVFTAFALEAYLNWVGRLKVPNWNERLNPREKIDVVAAQFKVPTDFGKRPWSIISDLFGFRNDIGHGKPAYLESSTVEPADEHLDAKLGEFLRMPWEKFCTERNAIRAREDVWDIAETFHAAARFGDNESTDPFFTGFQVHGASIQQGLAHDGNNDKPEPE